VVRVYGNFKIKQSLALIFGVFKEKSELKNLRFQLHISKTQRTYGFYEKTRKKKQVSGWWLFHYFVIF
jgi:hypothetical protein